MSLEWLFAVVENLVNKSKFWNFINSLKLEKIEDWHKLVIQPLFLTKMLRDFEIILNLYIIFKFKQSSPLAINTT